jgi:hypothetical protein
MLAHWRTQHAGAKDVIRARLAVTSQFSQELDSLVQIILTKAGLCLEGPSASPGRLIVRRDLPRRREQLYLPNLASDARGLSSNVACLHCFTAVESLV